MPYIVDNRLIPGLSGIGTYVTGPQKCFSRLHFGPIYSPLSDEGVYIKYKDQDFTVSKQYNITIKDNFNTNNSFNSNINVAYFVSEIKTNLDKTMFQEAAATARELKTSVNTAKYVLLCEYIDMPPIDTRTTYIDQVIILRQAKRLNSNIRSEFSDVKSRFEKKDYYESFLDENPLSFNSFSRLVYNLNQAFPKKSSLEENEVLSKGYF